MRNSILARLIRDERGQGLTEYLILLLLVSVVSIAAVRSFGNTVKDKLQVIRSHIESDVTLEDRK